MYEVLIKKDFASSAPRAAKVVRGKPARGEILQSLQDYFGTPHVFMLSHTVRVRHETFPMSTGKAYDLSQAVLMAHVGKFSL